MADVRYVVAMVRRVPPDKPHLPYKDVIRAELPIEHIYEFIVDSLFLPDVKTYSRTEVKAAVKDAVAEASKKAYNWLINNRKGP